MSEFSDAFLIRYEVEHKLLPTLLFSDKGKIILLLIAKTQGAFMLHLYNTVSEGKDYSCPYKANDFRFTVHSMNGEDGKPEKIILEMITPEPEQMPLCSRIYICHDRNLENIEYYTLEKSVEDSERLCGWSSSRVHRNHCEAPADKAEVLEKVKEMYFGRSFIEKRETEYET